jgi:hypothetical protein
MTRPSIFPWMILFGATMLMMAVGVRAADPDADLKSKKPGHELQIQAVEAERLVFQRDLAQREEICLKRFFSYRCIEEIRTEHLRRMREFDLRKEAALQALRDIDAELRARARTRRADDKTERQS